MDTTRMTDTPERIAILFAMVELEQARNDGMLTGGPGLTEKGRLEYERLKAAGFRPTEEEISRATQVLIAHDRQRQKSTWTATKANNEEGK